MSSASLELEMSSRRKISLLLRRWIKHKQGSWLDGDRGGGEEGQSGDEPLADPAPRLRIAGRLREAGQEAEPREAGQRLGHPSTHE